MSFSVIAIAVFVVSFLLVLAIKYGYDGKY